MNDKQRYNRTYLQWMKDANRLFWTILVREKDEILESIDCLFWVFVWFLIALTFPISFPIITAIAMWSEKKTILKRYGKEITRI